jgi:hypothetical protein
VRREDSSIDYNTLRSFNRQFLLGFEIGINRVGYDLKLTLGWSSAW